MHQSGSYSGSKCMDEQAVWPLSYSEVMTVGPSAPPIMHIADAALPHGAIIPRGRARSDRIASLDKTLCIFCPYQNLIMFPSSSDPSVRCSSDELEKRIGLPFSSGVSMRTKSDCPSSMLICAENTALFPGMRRQSF